MTGKTNWGINLTRWYCPYKFSSPIQPCSRCKHPGLKMENKGCECDIKICPIIYVAPLPWVKIEDMPPMLDRDDYHQNRYSEPVLVKNEITGQIAHSFYRYDHHNAGWVENNFPKGPDPEDYEMQFVTHWKIAE